jgi:GDP-L-fucose synthase
MKILVTGASGFLGTSLCAALAAKGHEIVPLSSAKCDLTVAGNLDRFSQHVYGQIYHLAAWTQAGDFCLKHPGEQWIINQQINTNILTWWQRRQPQAKLIFMGTSCSYDPALEMKEENYMAGTPIESLYTYAMTKRMLYAGVLALRRQFGLSYLHLVPSTLYGPGYHTDGRQMHFIFDLIRKILAAKLTGAPVVLWGDGHQRRELVYLDDFISVALDLASTCENETVNIGGGEEFSIRHFAGLICSMVGYDASAIRYDTARYVGAKSKCLSVEKLHRLVPGHKMTPLEQGLKKTIEWFWSQRDILLKDSSQPSPAGAAKP